MGISERKIGMSYPTTATTGSNVTGYKNIVAANPDLSTDANTATMSGSSYTFNGVDCVKDKMNFILEQNSGTVMYFDMGNDVAVSDPLSLIRAANSGYFGQCRYTNHSDRRCVFTAGFIERGKKKTNLICNDRSGEIVVLSTSDADLSQIAFSRLRVSFSGRKNFGKAIYHIDRSFSPGVYIARVRSSEGVDVFKFRIK